MRYLTLVALIGMVTWASPLLVAAEETPPSATARLDLESFDHVWNTIRDRHWDAEMNGLDWKAVREELRPRAERAATRDEVRAVMDEMIDRLGLSHYAVFPGEVYDTFARPEADGPRDGTTGIDVRVIGDEAVVTSVAEGSSGAAAGVRPGWVVVRIGEEELAPIIEKITGKFAGSLYEDLILAGAVLGRLDGPVDGKLAIAFRDGDERDVSLDLSLAEERGDRFQAGHLPPFRVWIETRRLDERIGYIAFNAFINPARLMPVFNQAMASFMDADGVVIDVRGNPGGFAPVAMGMAGWLIDEKGHHLGTMQTRELELKVVVLPRPQTYAGPVAVLTDGLSGSCSEMFAGGLQDLGRARIFGSRTMGATLPSAVERLPNGDGFQYAFANYVSADGHALEGVGVIPDVAIEPTREGLLQGKDAALDAALAWIDARQTGATD